MSTEIVEIKEWENNKILAGRELYDNKARETVALLSEKGIIEIVELKNGLCINANSYVGCIKLGDLQINVMPKIIGMPLYKLLKYAYGLRDLKLFDEAQHNIDKFPFFDILIYQLYIEVEELFVRGLNRSYIRRSNELEAPRGRIDMKKLSEHGCTQKASLPCLYFERSEDNPLNKILLSGLELGMKLVEDSKLKLQLHRLYTQMSEQISSIPLSRQTLKVAWNCVNRLTNRYKPILEIINILYESQGIQLEDGSVKMQLQGFFFDMNTFFETLISRLIRDFTEEYTLRDQYSLHDMFAYTPGFNPQRRKSPTPRPDFALMKGKKVVKLLDAKYRDLWETNLPGEMLYQLAIYAVSGIGDRTATILYPSMDKAATVQKIDINDPITSSKMASVILQPIDLVIISDLIDMDKSDKGRLSVYINSILSLEKIIRRVKFVLTITVT